MIKFSGNYEILKGTGSNIVKKRKTLIFVTEIVINSVISLVYEQV